MFLGSNPLEESVPIFIYCLQFLQQPYTKHTQIYDAGVQHKTVDNISANITQLYYMNQTVCHALSSSEISRRFNLDLFKFERKFR